MVFEPSVLFPHPCGGGGGGVELNTWSYYSIKIRKVNNSKSFQVKLIWKLI